jgi:ABC-type glycerol-3-phosphate transport system substrate-binding protein
MKKKMIIAIVVVLLVAMLAGCGGDANGAKKLVRGSWAGDTYTNEYLNLTFTMPEGWSSMSDEQLATLMGLSADNLAAAGVEVNKEMLELMTIVDMQAQDPMTGNNVLVNIENIGKMAKNVVSEEDYIDLTREQLEEAYGYTFSDYTTETVAGETYTMAKGEVTMSGIAMSQYFYVRKVDKYMLAIIVTVVDGSDVSVVMNQFS